MTNVLTVKRPKKLTSEAPMPYKKKEYTKQTIKELVDKQEELKAQQVEFEKEQIEDEFGDS